MFETAFYVKNLSAWLIIRIIKNILLVIILFQKDNFSLEMPLHQHSRQYNSVSEVEREIIIPMSKAVYLPPPLIGRKDSSFFTEALYSFFTEEVVGTKQQ